MQISLNKNYINKDIAIKATNILLVFFTVSVVINLIIILAMSVIRNTNKNRTVPYIYETSDKSVSYVITNYPTSTHYDLDVNGLYISNDFYKKSTPPFILGKSLDELKSIYFDNYTDYFYTEINDYITLINKPYECNQMLLSTKFNENQGDSNDLSEYVKRYIPCL